MRCSRLGLEYPGLLWNGYTAYTENIFTVYILRPISTNQNSGMQVSSGHQLSVKPLIGGN